MIHKAEENRIREFRDKMHEAGLGEYLDMIAWMSSKPKLDVEQRVEMTQFYGVNVLNLKENL